MVPTSSLLLCALGIVMALMGNLDSWNYRLLTKETRNHPIMYLQSSSVQLKGVVTAEYSPHYNRIL
jgi:hypothetical protein